MPPYDDEAYLGGHTPLGPSRQTPDQPAFMQGSPQPVYRNNRRQGNGLLMWGCGCLVVVVLLVIVCCAGIYFYIRPTAVDGPNFAADVDLLFEGDETQVEFYIESLGPVRRSEIVLTELENTSGMLDLFTNSAISSTMLDNAYSLYEVPEEETIYGVIDASLSFTDTAENGMVFTENAIYICNDGLGTPPGASKLEYGRFPVTTFRCDSNWSVWLTDDIAFDTSGSDALSEEIVDLLGRISGAFIEEARVNPDPEEFWIEEPYVESDGGSIEKEL